MILSLVPVGLDFDPNRDEYRRVIKRPLDLTIILHKLEGYDHYHTIQDWLRDFELMFDNTITSNSPASHVATIEPSS
jgi:hypothetical protein